MAFAMRREDIMIKLNTETQQIHEFAPFHKINPDNSVYSYCSHY